MGLEFSLCNYASKPIKASKRIDNKKTPAENHRKLINDNYNSDISDIVIAKIPALKRHGSLQNPTNELKAKKKKDLIVPFNIEFEDFKRHQKKETASDRPTSYSYDHKHVLDGTANDRLASIQTCGVE